LNARKKRECEALARYWVSLGREDPDANRLEKRFEKELEDLSNHLSEDGQCSYVTEDLEDAKNVAKEAVEIYKKYGYEDLADCVCINSQPECPKCGHLGRFSEGFCSKCGAELTPSEEIDAEQ